MSERNDRVRGDIEDARETVRIGGESESRDKRKSGRRGRQ